MPSQMTILAAWVDAVLDQLEVQQLDRKVLASGLWKDGAPRIATKQVGLILARRLWQRVASVSIDPLLGVKVGLGLPLQAMNLTGLVMMQSPDLRTALLNMERYQQLVSNSGRLSAHQRGDGLEVRYAVTECQVPMHTMQMDSLFSGIVSFLRRCCVRPFKPTSMEFVQPDTSLSRAYAELLECPAVLGRPAMRMYFDDKTLDLPFQGADPSLLSLLQSQAENILRLQQSSEFLEAAVRAALSARGFRDLSCDELARGLGITPRTLQRRLSEAGMPFRRLLEAARMEEAYYLLTQTRLPLTAIAEKLGYTESSSFWHAVKAAWGVTPRDLRTGASSPPPTKRCLDIRP